MTQMYNTKFDAFAVICFWVMLITARQTHIHTHTHRPNANKKDKSGIWDCTEDGLNGFFLWDPRLYLSEFWRKSRKTLNGWVEKGDWELKLAPLVYKFWEQNLLATGVTNWFWIRTNCEFHCHIIIRDFLEFFLKEWKLSLAYFQGVNFTLKE